ncbi:cytochrome P450 [Actinomadura geliboluensis]|uniref:cytochrome P450 n=1 Tax=Actinomadura geliboluensis TaxID=882440 RepID=UPI0037147862
MLTCDLIKKRSGPPTVHTSKSAAQAAWPIGDVRSRKPRSMEMTRPDQPEPTRPEQTTAVCPVHVPEIPQMNFNELPMREDRGPAYKLLLEHAPLAYTGQNPAGQDTYVIAGREAVDQGLTSPEVFKSDIVHKKVGSPVPLVPVDTNERRHREIRELLRPHFSRAAVGRLEPGLRDFVDHLIDQAAARGTCDVTADLAVPLAAHAFMQLFGLPVQDRDRLIAWKDGILNNTTLQLDRPDPKAQAAADELIAYLREHLAQPVTGAARDEGVLPQLLAGAGKDALSPDELLGLAVMCVIAGFDTITGAVSTAFRRLAAEPRLRRQIAENPDVIPAAVEELLRLDPPAPFLPRVTTQDTRVGGHQIPAGSQVNFCVGAANRDLPDTERPDEADFARRGRHLSFGYGKHLCLGIHLARLEIRVALEAWHRRIPDYELADGADTGIQWPHSGVRIDHLPLVFQATA